MCSFERSGDFQRTVRCYISEYSTLRDHSYENLKSLGVRIALSFLYETFNSPVTRNISRRIRRVSSAEHRYLEVPIIVGEHVGLCFVQILTRRCNFLYFESSDIVICVLRVSWNNFRRLWKNRLSWLTVPVMHNVYEYCLLRRDLISARFLWCRLCTTLVE
jgi:hypothetical protein